MCYRLNRTTTDKCHFSRMQYITSSIKEFTNQAKQEHDEFFLPQNTNHTLSVSPYSLMYTTNDDHDAYLFHCWNRSNKNTLFLKKANHQYKHYITTSTSKKEYHKSHCLPTNSANKDNLSVTSTLNTWDSLHPRCTLLMLNYWHSWYHP